MPSNCLICFVVDQDGFLADIETLFTCASKQSVRHFITVTLGLTLDRPHPQICTGCMEKVDNLDGLFVKARQCEAKLRREYGRAQERWINFQLSTASVGVECQMDVMDSTEELHRTLDSDTSLCSAGSKSDTTNQRVAATDKKTPRTYHCKQCDLVFQNYGALNSHKSRQHTGPTTCTICKKSLAGKGSLNKHMRIHKAIKRFQVEHFMRMIENVVEAYNN